MPKFTVYPWLGTHQTVEGVSAEVTPSKDLVILTGDKGPGGMAGAYRWEKDKWACYRPGEPPHSEDEKLVSNDAANNPYSR
jgi:hypothetical protein